MRLSAWFLVLLIALPFTAPFSTCDLAMLLQASPAQHATEHSLGSSLVDATTLAPAVTMEEDEGACELATPFAMTDRVAVVATVDSIVPTMPIVRTSPLPLRL